MYDPFFYNQMGFFDGFTGYSEPVEEVRPSIEQCSICARKFDIPKNLKGAQRLIPIHAELFNTKCGGSGKAPKD